MHFSENSSLEGASWVDGWSCQMLGWPPLQASVWTWRQVYIVCLFLGEFRKPSLINVNLSTMNYLSVFMVGHWVGLHVCWLEGMFWPCLVWGRVRRLLALAVGAQSSDSQVPLRVLSSRRSCKSSLSMAVTRSHLSRQQLEALLRHLKLYQN